MPGRVGEVRGRPGSGPGAGELPHREHQAGPGGGTAYKPVGTVCLAWASRDGWQAAHQEIFSGDRHQIRMQAVAAALQGVVNQLGG